MTVSSVYKAHDETSFSKTPNDCSMNSFPIQSDKQAEYRTFTESVDNKKGDDESHCLTPMSTFKEREPRRLGSAISLKTPHSKYSSFQPDEMSIPSYTSTNTTNSTQASGPSSFISPRTSSLAKVKVAPLNIQKSRVTYSQMTTGVELTPFTPSKSFASLTPPYESIRSNSVPQENGVKEPQTPETPISARPWRGSNRTQRWSLQSRTTRELPQLPSLVTESQSQRKQATSVTLTDHRQNEQPNIVGVADKSTDSSSLSSLVSLSTSANSYETISCKEYDRLRQRHNIARELYYTERQFAQDMAVVVRIYMCGSADLGSSMRQIDISFSNVTHVMDLSLSIVAILESQIPPQILQGDGALRALDIIADAEMRVGKASCSALTGQFYEVYETYIHNNRRQMDLCYELTNIFRRGCDSQQLKCCPSTGYSTNFSPASTPKSRARSSSGKPSPESSVEFSQLDKAKSNEWIIKSKLRAAKFTTGWSLDSSLIKPTQRLAKYPLFLKSLLQYSDVNHTDYPDLEKAYKRSIQYLDCINARYEA